MRGGYRSPARAVFHYLQAVTDDAEKIRALRLICEKYAPSNMEGFDEAIRKSLAHTGIVKIELREVSGKQKKHPKEK